MNRSRKWWSRKVRVEIRQILAESGIQWKLQLASGREMWVPARGTRIDLDDYGTRYAVLSRRTCLKAQSALKKARI